MDWQALIDLDKQLLLWFNGSQSLYLDSLVRTLTNALTWIPFYLTLFYVVIKNNENMQKILLVLASVGLCVLIAGTIDDTRRKVRFLLCPRSQHIQHRHLLLVAGAQPTPDYGDGDLVADQLLDAPLSGCSLSWRHIVWSLLGSLCRLSRLLALPAYGLSFVHWYEFYFVTLHEDGLSA